MRRLAFLFLVLTLTACYQPSVPTTQKAKTVYSRDEFRKLVIGKTQDEVIKAVGKPFKTHDDPSNVFWMYQGITFDPVSDNHDNFIFINFVDGKAVKVGT